MPGTRKDVTPLQGRQPARAACKIRVSSVLPSSFRDELERIVFFNPGQALIATRLVELVHRYGIPAVVEEEGRLRFNLPTLGPVQTLYALDETEGPRLAGVAMFTRDGTTTLTVVHLAVHEDYTSRGKWAAGAVVARLLNTIRDAASRTHGVRSVRILYPHEAELRGRR